MNKNVKIYFSSFIAILFYFFCLCVGLSWLVFLRCVCMSVFIHIGSDKGKHAEKYYNHSSYHTLKLEEKKSTRGNC